MNVIVKENEIVLENTEDFDIAKTFECGQCFRWNDMGDGIYTGVAFGKALRLRQNGDKIHIYCNVDDYEQLWKHYFDLDRDYTAIRKQLSIDDFMKRATDFGAGIRILKQDKWEALCSFIISQNNNIPRIKKIVETLCEHFGEEISFENKKHYSFPSAMRIAECDIAELAPLNCGYRAEYIIDAARAVASNALDLEKLALTSSDNARIELKKLRGVGDKVADCVLLFGLNMLDAFPVDVWMKRAVSKHFEPNFDPSIFSPYAGIAQQYIFYYERNNS